MAEENLNHSQEPEGNPGNGGGNDVRALEERLAKQEETIANLNKGIEKLASKLNQGAGDNKEGGDRSPKPEQKYSSVVKTLYMEKHSEIETVWDEMAEEAAALGQDPIDYYESKKGWQLEAKARVEAERKREEAKVFTESPSGKPAGNERVDFSTIKPEQIAGLSAKQREDYRNYLRTQNPIEMKRVE